MIKTYLAMLRDESISAKEGQEKLMETIFRPTTSGIVRDDGMPYHPIEVLTRNK